MSCHLQKVHECNSYTMLLIWRVSLTSALCVIWQEKGKDDDVTTGSVISLHRKSRKLLHFSCFVSHLTFLCTWCPHEWNEWPLQPRSTGNSFQCSSLFVLCRSKSLHTQRSVKKTQTKSRESRNHERRLSSYYGVNETEDVHSRSHLS